VIGSNVFSAWHKAIWRCADTTHSTKIFGRPASLPTATLPIALSLSLSLSLSLPPCPLLRTISPSNARAHTGSPHPRQPADPATAPLRYLFHVACPCARAVLSLPLPFLAADPRIQQPYIFARPSTSFARTASGWQRSNRTDAATPATPGDARDEFTLAGPRPRPSPDPAIVNPCRLRRTTGPTSLIPPLCLVASSSSSTGSPPHVLSRPQTSPRPGFAQQRLCRSLPELPESTQWRPNSNTRSTCLATTNATLHIARRRIYRESIRRTPILLPMSALLPFHWRQIFGDILEDHSYCSASSLSQYLLRYVISMILMRIFPSLLLHKQFHLNNLHKSRYIIFLLLFSPLLRIYRNTSNILLIYYVYIEFLPNFFISLLGVFNIRIR
jgi:hypothetical protein